MKRKEHKLKIVPVGGEAIVLALQSKEQTEQWLRVIRFKCAATHALQDQFNGAVTLFIFLLTMAFINFLLCSLGDSGNKPKAG